jgi:hypothetical protein
MTQKDSLQKFPTRRIKPIDGMAVTAQVWEEAHEYHTLLQRFHNLYAHGPGILTGLDVRASDPPDSTVYILPGLAVDPVGNVIALTQPVAYDFGQEIEGLIYLLLNYEESRPRSGDTQEQGGSPYYVDTHFAVHARPTLPDTPWIELARVKRQTRDAFLLDAQDAEHPGVNEIDMRFCRRVAGPPHLVPEVLFSETLCLGISYVGEVTAALKAHGQGIDALVRSLRWSTSMGGNLQVRLCADVNVPLDSGLKSYTVLYLASQGAFQLGSEEMSALYDYIQGGGTVFFESCRRELGEGDSPAEASFADLCDSFGLTLEELPAGHSLLSTPYLFAAPPAGFERQGTPKVLVGDGIIFSTHDYGCLWQGQRRDGLASREEIRSALEWGYNIVAYASGRRSTAAE